MDNVNDLNRTSNLVNGPQTQETIYLSSVTDNNKTSVNIDATNGLKGVSNDPERPAVRINPNHHGARTRRTINSMDELNTVDPNTIIPRKHKPAPISPKDIAMSDLEKTVNRKREEFRQFVDYAVQADAINRENVENGLDTVNGELQYMPDALHVPISEEDKVKPDTEVDTTKHADDEDEFFDSDFDDDNFDDFEAPIITDAPIVNGIGDWDETDPDTDDDPDDDNDGDPDLDDSDDIPVDEDHIPEYDDVDMDNIVTESIDNDPDDVVDQDSYDEPIAEEKKDNTPATEEDEFDISENSIQITNSALAEVNASSSDFDIDEADFEDVTSDTEENLTDEELVKISEASEKHLRSEILQKIVNTGKKLNTAQLSVSTKVMNIKDVIRNVPEEITRIATWPLTFAGRPYTASALKGPEIALMADADTSGEDGVGLSTVQARIMFEHDANPYRPNTLEAWAKTIPYADVENIFAALYIASIRGANYIPMACSKPSCMYAYLSDDTDIEKMVKFDTDEAKERFNRIKKSKITAENTGSYESVISIINDNFAVGLKLPSIFTVMYEYNSLNAEFVKKYTAMVSIIQYVDYMYYIDPDTSTLVPIGWKTYAGDHTKTFKSKIATYAKILKQFDDTDFSIMMALINSMITKASEQKNITFEIPATKCPKCGADIPARAINARGLVFMRQRLVELATTPTGK